MKNIPPYVLAIAVALIVILVAFFGYRTMAGGGQSAMSREQIQQRMQEYQRSTQQRGGPGGPGASGAPSPGTPPGPGTGSGR